uniref:Uncharacterized protein n=1 Tax=Acanthochromis polyacanthus TaxID=80966 RepID=A0A3Q1EVT4_9TELE
MVPAQSLTSSQSLNFSMSSTQSMSTTVLPQSRSQVSSLPSTWSDHSVNISLDFLGPGMQPPKPSQPSLNTLQQGEWISRSDMNCRIPFKILSVKCGLKFDTLIHKVCSVISR